MFSLLRSHVRSLFVLSLFIIFRMPLLAAPPPQYHLELEANPAAAFPYLSKFGTAIELHVYPSGVRAEALWLNSFSKNGAAAVTIANPLGRMYVDMPVAEIAPLLRKIGGAAASIEQNAIPVRGPTLKGNVHGIDATRYRLIYGPEAWIDLWTTTVIPENPQMRRITEQLVSGISPGTATFTRSLPGTPLYVELNFRRFKKVPLLKVKQLTFEVSAEEEKDALELGPVYMRAPLLDKLLTLGR